MQTEFRESSTDVCKEHSICVSEAHVLGSGEIVGPKHEQLLSINASSIIAGRIVVYKDKIEIRLRINIVVADVTITIGCNGNVQNNR